MKSYLENLQIDCWLHTGRALGRVQPCICMRAESARAGLVLRAVNELSRERAPARRKLTFHSKRKDAFHSLYLRFSPASSELRKLCVEVEGGAPILEFTPAGLAEVTSALETWINGGEDFGLHPTGKPSDLGRKDTSSGELWFWTTMLP